MRYKLLGKSGLRVSELCLGTMTFGEDWGWGSSREESRKVYDAFLEAGGNFIDTANVYTNGTSERFLGEFMQGHREQFVLATKYTLTPPRQRPQRGRQPPQEHGAGGRGQPEAAQDRLHRPVLAAHLGPDHARRRSHAGLRRPGAAGQNPLRRASPTCRPGSWRKANTLAELRGWTPFVGLQIEYSLIERTAGAGTAADGGGPGPGRHGLVAAGGRRADRQATGSRAGPRTPGKATRRCSNS